MMETYKGVVCPNQIDHADQLNAMWYISKFDEATWHLFSGVGITKNYIRDNQKGIATLEQITRYKLEVTAGDLIVIKSKILEVKNKTIRFLHAMYNAATEKEVATSELLGVHIDRLTRKNCDFPYNIKAKCEALIWDAKYDLARHILSNDFVSPQEIAAARGLTYDDEALRHLAETLPSEEMLHWLHENDYVLIAGTPSPMSLLEIRNLNANILYMKSGGWYSNDKEEFSGYDKMDAEWLMLRKGIVSNSTRTSWDEQQRFLTEAEYGPNVAQTK